MIDTGLRAELELANGGVLASDHGLLHSLVSSTQTASSSASRSSVSAAGTPPRSDVRCEAATAALILTGSVG